MKISLSECPALLRLKAENYLSTHEGSKIISITKYDMQVYIDKSIITTVYSLYIHYYNVFTVMSLSICSNEKWNRNEVCVSSMLTGDIFEIIENCDWFTGLRK